MAKLLTGTRIYGTGTIDTQLFVNGNNTTISTTTGALVVSGGAGIGGDVQVGGLIYRNGISVGYGYTGSIGFTGSSGANGFAGSVGYTGSASTQIGYTGSRGDLGYTGSVGYTGSRGDLGYTGSVGYTGSRGDLGYTGSQGDIGYSGSVGYTGSQGDIGYSGSDGYTGSQGDIGYSGSDGYTGSQGDIGYSGSVGYTGSQGDLGYTGSVGYTGSQGDLGYTGSVGYTGSQGDLGYTGSVGPVGGSNNQVLFNQGGVATSTQNLQFDGTTLTIGGPVIFNGTATYVLSTNTIYTDNLMNLHVPPDSTGTNHTWTGNDGKDIGFVFHYYSGTDKDAGLVLANDTNYLEWYSNGTESLSSGTFTGTEYGTFKTGSIILENTTTSISTDTGTLQVAGGVGIAKDVFVGNRILEAKGWVYKTSNYTAVSGEKIIANTSGGTFTITLPASPQTGWSVIVADGNNWKTNNLTVARNGSTIRGLSEDLTVDIGTISLTFAYDGTTWQFYTSMGPQEVASQTGNSGKVLSTDGTSTYWATAGAGGSNSLVDDDTSTSTQYLGMYRETTGTTTNVYVASSKLYFNANTGVLNSVDFNSLSDVSFKENVESITDSYDIIKQLNPVRFNWKDNGRLSYGVLAQDVEKILPEIVNETDGVKSVSYLQLIALLIDSVKYQGKEIEKLKKELGKKKNGNTK